MFFIQYGMVVMKHLRKNIQVTCFIIVGQRLYLFVHLILADLF